MSQRLLLVDDEPKLLRALELTFRAEGFEVQTARTGAEALLRLAEAMPDLIISDIRMPGMDGYSFARKIRSSPRTSLIPIVFLTAKDRVEDRIQGFRTGVDSYLTKPFEMEELLAVVASILSRVKRTHKEITRLATDEVEEAVPVRDEELTDGEWRIAEAVARGLSNKEIASECNISIRTVEHHIRHILAKKGLSNRVGIARYVFERKAPE